MLSLMLILFLICKNGVNVAGEQLGPLEESEHDINTCINQGLRIDPFIEDKWRIEDHIVSQILQGINPDNMKETLRYLSERPHLAATPRDAELADYIREKFEEAGFDSSQLVPYNVYLSKPDPQNPNKIWLKKGQESIFESAHREIPIHEGDEDPDFIDAFSAFTPAGEVTTHEGVGVVYVNYGRLEDFERVHDLGVNVSGHIVMVKYGKIYRGNKVKHAEQFGATGVIIFSDPEEVAAEGTTPEDVYDNSWWLPGSGMQRGSTFLGDGDPLTPGWPSTENAFRIAESEAALHKIPAQPIGYDDAKQILSRLSGDDAPEDWQGGIEGLTYKLGPFLDEENSDVSLTLSTHNVAQIEESVNVIGVIRGSEEPDRYVLLGNHRDAWGYGAADPSSGTAQLLETARVFGSLLEEGWRPRRTLVFCSWGAEEFGLIGSTEWVEENIDKLQSRAVAYLNTDTCASGPMLHLRGSPLIRGVFTDITKLVPGVQNSSKSLYEEWKEYTEAVMPDEQEHPVIENLGSGSDYAPFSVYAGIPSADIRFKRDQARYNITIYPAYHTGYETFYMVSKFLDPEFKIHEACSRLTSLALKYLADSSILPYSLQKLPDLMLTNLEQSKHREKLREIYDKYDELEKSVKAFGTAVETFRSKTMRKICISPLEIRAINDQMMKLEQIFLLPQGVPESPTTRNAAFAPSQFDNYAAEGFPGLVDLLHEYDSLNATEKILRNKMIQRHISDLTIMADRAADFLKDTHLL